VAVRREFADFESVLPAVVNFESRNFVKKIGMIVGQSKQISKDTLATRGASHTSTHPSHFHF